MSPIREWVIRCPACGAAVPLREKNFTAAAATYSCSCRRELTLEAVTQLGKQGTWRPDPSVSVTELRGVSYLIPPHVDRGPKSTLFLAEFKLP